MSTKIGGNGITLPSFSDDPTSVDPGFMYYNTSTKAVKHWDGADWSQMSNRFAGLGGTEYTIGDYKLHVFTSSGTFNAYSAGTIDVFIAAGGGGGGADNGGGGGAGGLLQLFNIGINPGASSIIVGAGGSGHVGDGVGGGTSGGDSAAFGYTAIGGGLAGSQSINGLSGGSGGGGSWDSAAPGSGTAGQGYAGGNGTKDTTGGSSQGSAGGGGGAGGVGGTATTMQRPGNGGPGVNLSSYIGTSIGDSGWLCGGGAGGLNNADMYPEGTFPVALDAGYGFGGQGGGGDVPPSRQWWGDNGQANTGGGGAGGAHDVTISAGTRQHGGNGGSGIVIIRYKI